MKNKAKNLNRKTSILATIVVFAFIAVFGLSVFTGNKQDTSIGTSKASTQEPSDINSDGIVDIFDLSTLLSNWSYTGINTSDLNNDGNVNIFDLSILLSKWGLVVVVTPTPTPPTSSLAGASNTGYDSAPDYPGSLNNCSGPIQSNTTYRFCNFEGGLGIGTAVNHPTNVTFYGCRFASNSVADANVAIYGDNITFDYSSFVPSADTAPPTTYSQGYQYGIDLRYAGKVTVDHSDFWGWGNGIQFGSSTQAKPFVVKNSWFHDARNDGGIDHTDAILSNEGGPTYMVFDHNTIVSVGNTQGLALQTESRGYDHVTITNNYFSGFGYTVAIGENIPCTNITFTGNTFGTDIEPVYGDLYSDSIWNQSTTGNLWRNNKWHVVLGSYYTPTTDDGKYWTPNGISATDWTL